MNKWVAGLIAGLIVGGAVAGAAYLLRPKTPQGANDMTSQNTNPTSDANLQVTDETVGTGAEAVNGKKVVVHYRGTLTNGTKFDSSYDRNQPFDFVLGTGQVIKGWEQGIQGMKVGGKRKLVIPPSLGYGSQAAGTIPPNSTLVFEVELLAVQ